MAQASILRRTELRRTAIGVAICSALPIPAIAAQKISKKAVAYQDHPDGDKQYAKCAQF
jgi:hypothetical protein